MVQRFITNILACVQLRISMPWHRIAVNIRVQINIVRLSTSNTQQMYILNITTIPLILIETILPPMVELLEKIDL